MPGTVLGARDHISTISKVDKACVSLSLYFSKKDKKIKELEIENIKLNMRKEKY